MPKATPHPYDRVRDLVNRIGPLWQEALGLGHYDIQHVFSENYHAEDEGDDYRTTAETQARWQYLMAKIIWHLPSAARSTDESLEWTLVHELGHVLLDSEQSMVTSAKDAVKMELATEMVTRALIKLGGSKL